MFDGEEYHLVEIDYADSSNLITPCPAPRVLAKYVNILRQFSYYIYKLFILE